MLVYNDASTLHAVNLSALTEDAGRQRSRLGSSVVLHRTNSLIDALGIYEHVLCLGHILQ